MKKLTCHCGAVEVEINLGCVDEVKVEDLKDIVFFDGLNHPMDKK